MQRWTVQDRYGNEIYLTEERWQHITSKHLELVGHLDDLLSTIQRGKTKQEKLDPQRYRYRYPYEDPLYANTHIVALVVFSYQEDSGGRTVRNNFVTTAWGE